MPEQRYPLPPKTASNRALNQLGAKWVLPILEYLMREPQRFVAIQREGVPGVSTEQLRTRLNAMVEDGLITRTRYREVPPRVDYEITEKGRDALPVIMALAQWGRRYCPLNRKGAGHVPGPLPEYHYDNEGHRIHDA